MISKIRFPKGIYKTILLSVVVFIIVLSAGPAAAAENLFLTLLQLFAKGASMVASDATSNAGSAIGEGACWFCPVFSLIFDVANTLATSVAQKLSGLFLVLLGVGALFFLLFRTGKMLVSLQEVDLMQFLSDIFKYLGRVMVASVLLSFSLGIFYYLISPVVQATLTVGNIIYTTGGAAEMKVVKMVRDASEGSFDLTVKCSDAAALADQNAGKAEKAFSPGVKEALMCNLKQVAASLVSGMTSGMFTFFYGLTAGPLELPNSLVMLQGVILFFIFLFIFISYPLKLLDAMFQLAFVTALTPLWVVLWAFPATVGYTKKAWEMFFGAIMTFFMINVIGTLVLNVLDVYAFPDTMWDALFSANAEKVLEQFSLGGLEFLSLIAMSAICLKMLGTGKNLAQAFGGLVLDLGINETAGKATKKAMGSTINAGKTLGRAGLAIAGQASKWGEAVGQKVAQKADFDKRVDTAAAATAATGADIDAKQKAGAYKTDSDYKAQRTRRNNQTLDDMLVGLNAMDQRAALNALNDKITAGARDKGMDANAQNMQARIAERMAKLNSGEDVLHNREAANMRRRAILDKVKAGASGKEAVKDTPRIEPQKHTFKGDIIARTNETVTTNFINQDGLEQTNTYDDKGKLKESQVITDRYLNGQAKTVAIFDADGKRVGTRTLEGYHPERWKQQNADGTQTTQTVEKNKDGSVETIRDTVLLDAAGNVAEKMTYEREKLSMVKGDDGQEMMKRETWTTDRQTGEQHKRTETGIDDGNGGLRVLHQQDESYVISQEKQENGSGLKTVTSVDYAYDEAGNLVSRRMTDAAGNKTLRLYNRPDPSGSNRAFSYSEYDIKRGKTILKEQHYFKREERQWL